MKRAALWTLMNGGMLAALWYGFVEGVQGAQNVGLLLAWVTIITSLFAVSENIADDLVRRHGGMSVPMWISWLLDFAVVTLLSWHGWMWTAGFYLFAALVLHGCISLAQERARKRTEKAEA